MTRSEWEAQKAELEQRLRKVLFDSPEEVELRQQHRRLMELEAKLEPETSESSDTRIIEIGRDYIEQARDVYTGEVHIHLPEKNSAFLQETFGEGAFPSLWNVPYRRNPYFTGREDILKHVHEMLSANKAAALAQVQAISGLGGIGKTQTAVEYAYKYHEEYTAVFWVTADSAERLISDFLAIAGVLNLPEKDENDHNLIVRAVKRWFIQHSHWLLIVDNADEPELLENFIPPDFKGCILLTSRAQVFDNLGIPEPVELEGLSPTEAHTFLVKRTCRSELELEEENAVEQLACELAYLPLALEQAGAYIYKMKSSFQHYLAGYRKHGVQLLQRMKPVTGKYSKSVFTTWSMNFKQVQHISPAAADVLYVSAFLSPDKIPLELISSGARELGHELSEALADVTTDPLILDELLETLAQYSLIHQNIQLRTFDIHRLVQVAIRETMSEVGQKKWAERAIKAVSQAFPIVEFSEWPRCERLLNHAQNCAELITIWKFEWKEATLLLDRCGAYLYERARYAEAESLYKQALTIRKNTLDPDHPDIGQSFNRLAVNYSAQAKYSEAEQFYQQTLTIWEKALGAENPRVGACLNNLAEVYKDQGRYADAEPLYQRTLEIFRNTQGHDSIYVAIEFNNLGLLYFQQKRYNEAETLYQQALTIQENSVGREHPTTATTLNNLAKLYHAQGKFEKAIPLCKQSLAIRETLLGTEHPDVAFSLNILAEIYRAQEKYHEAAPLYQRALALREKGLGVEHSLVALSLNNLALLHENLNEYSEAEKLFKRALTIREAVLGPEHPDVAVTLENYAAFLHKTDRHGEADDLEHRANVIRSKSKN